MVGALYAPGDPRRDAGFTIYYMGINIGAAAAPLLCGWIGHRYGWSYGFALAGCGLLLGLVTFARGRRHLRGLAEPPAEARLDQRVFAFVTREWLIYAGSLLIVCATWYVLSNQNVVGLLISVTGLVVSSFILYYAFARCEREERRRLIACAVLLLFTCW